MVLAHFFDSSSSYPRLLTSRGMLAQYTSANPARKGTRGRSMKMRAPFEASTS